tara:strand:+ start:185 stop:568 length:384 start_codon:yes stop_codon:yes gene_type:complete
MKLTDYLNSINQTKVDLMDTEDEMVEKKYPPFPINRCLSYFPDTIMQANEMNQHSHLDNRMQYDFYLHSIRKRKRWSKWMKNETPDQLEAIKEMYGYSNRKAIEALAMLSDEQIEHIVFLHSKGGRK